VNAEETHRRIAALANIDQRSEGVAALARHVDARAVFVFAPDRGAGGKLIPAPGFPSRLPSSRGWRALLARASSPGIHCAEVAYPSAVEDTPAVAYAYAGVTFVMVGPRDPSAKLAEQLATTAPLLSAVLAAETETLFARSDLAIAREAAERAAVLTRALDRARLDAERATRVKDEFLAMLGHELRNPLAPMVTALQMLRLEGVSSRFQGVLERQVTHLQRLVDDLLDVSRITSGKIELRKEHVEIATIVQRALEMSRPLTEKRRNELIIDVPESGLTVDGDPARLAQVMANLVTNASKYSDPDKRISIRAERAGATVLISVEDQGIGIEPTFLDRVFDNFVQTPQGLDRASGGLGLGLAIVRSLVDLHGGNVRAFSNGALQGSRFVVQLPAIDGTTTGPPPTALDKPAAIVACARLLVVDDNSDAADLMGELLTEQGHSVHVAHSGPEALGLLASFTPDAALLDIGLPVMDGYELAAALRGELPNIRLIALTGYGASTDRQRTRDAGFDAHLTKPVSLSALSETLAELLRRGQAPS
jgi:signal transduction histidine kinase